MLIEVRFMAALKSMIRTLRRQKNEIRRLRRLLRKADCDLIYWHWPELAKEIRKELGRNDKP